MVVKYKQVSGFQKMGWENGTDYKGAWKNFWHDGDILYLDSHHGYTIVYIGQNL